MADFGGRAAWGAKLGTRQASTKRGSARRVLGLVGFVLLLGTSQLIAPAGAGALPQKPAAADRPLTGTTLVEIASGAHLVKRGGLWWRLTLDMSVDGDSAASISASISRTTTGGEESHTWSVGGLPQRSISHEAADKWAIDPPLADVSPLFSMDLTFVATKRIADTCSSGSEYTYEGTLKGAFTLATGLSTKTISGTDISFPASKVVSDSGCTQKHLVCVEDTSFFAVGDGWNLSGNHFAHSSDLQLWQSTTLSSPANASRLDQASSSDVAFKPTSSGFTLTGGAGSILSGTAAVTFDAGSPTTWPCYSGKKKHTQSISGALADYSSSPLVADVVLVPQMATGTTGYGAVTVKTFS